jgi:hypothetical protein
MNDHRRRPRVHERAPLTGPERAQLDGIEDELAASATSMVLAFQLAWANPRTLGQELRLVISRRAVPVAVTATAGMLAAVAAAIYFASRRR